MKSLQRILAVATFAASCALAGAANATTVYWADWNSIGDFGVNGSITAPSGNVGVTYSGSVYNLQLNHAGPTDYWVNTSPPVGTPVYTQGVVNRPSNTDIIELSSGGSKTITFSRPVSNVFLALTSWNGNNTTFDTPFSIVSQGCGYWGCGSFTVSGPGPTYTSFYGNGEVHGVLEFSGSISSINFTDTDELWHGFTLGISDVVGAPAPVPGAGLLSLGVLALAAAAAKGRRALGF
jgi:hypothetical protein